MQVPNCFPPLKVKPIFSCQDFLADPRASFQLFPATWCETGSFPPGFSDSHVQVPHFIPASYRFFLPWFSCKGKLPTFSRHLKRNRFFPTRIFWQTHPASKFSATYWEAGSFTPGFSGRHVPASLFFPPLRVKPSFPPGFFGRRVQVPNFFPPLKVKPILSRQDFLADMCKLPSFSRHLEWNQFFLARIFWQTHPASKFSATYWEAGSFMPRFSGRHVPASLFFPPLRVKPVLSRQDFLADVCKFPTFSRHLEWNQFFPAMIFWQTRTSSQLFLPLRVKPVFFPARFFWQTRASSQLFPATKSETGSLPPGFSGRHVQIPNFFPPFRVKPFLSRHDIQARANFPLFPAT
jgi:hypothetical protein